MLRPCCAEWLAWLCNPLIYLVPAKNGLQHATGTENEAETGRNPLFSGLSGGDPSRTGMMARHKGLDLRDRLKMAVRINDRYRPR